MKKFFYTWKIWQIIFISCIISGVLLYIGIKSFGCINGINGGSDWGDLLSGTIGIGISTGAMIAVIATLREQQKMNLISKYERFISIYQQNRKIIEELWFSGIKNIGIEKFLSYELRNNTFSELFKICEKSELLFLSNDLNLLTKIEYKNLIMSEIWDAIPYDCKKYAGFYMAWNKRSFDSGKNEFGNKLVDIFRSEMRNIPDCIPENIPWIEIVEKEDLVLFKQEHLENTIVEINSKSKENIIVEKIKIIFGKNDKLTFDKNNLVLQSYCHKQYAIKDLFTIGDFFVRIENLYDELKCSNDIHRSIITEFYLYMKYKSNDWTYKCFLEFNIYKKDNSEYKSSIIFKQIEDYE